MKRFISIVLAIITVITSLFSLTGCNGENVRIYTRAEWISAIATIFNLEGSYSDDPYFSDVKSTDAYFDAIQACAEWEIIDKEGNFEPNKRADVNFAITTAVKSIGLDKIAKSVDGKELKNEDEMIDFFNENSDTDYINGSNLYMDTANEILSDISRIYNELVLKKSQKVLYTNKVMNVKESDVRFSMDGKSATISNIKPTVGTILVLEPSYNYPYGRYAKVKTINGNRITYVQPKFEEMFEQISVVGTYEATAMGFIPANEGVKVKTIGGVDAVPQSSYFGKNGDLVNAEIYVQKPISSEDGSSVVPLASANLGDIELELEIPIGKSASVTGGVSLKDIVATADIDLWGPIVKKAEVQLDSTIEVSAGLKAEKALEKTVPLGTIPFKLFGVVGFDVEVGIKIGVEGSISVVFSFDTSAGVNYKPLAIPKYIAQAKNPNLDLEVKAKAYVKPEIKASFVVACFDVANIGIYGGAEANATLKLGTSDDSGCLDINAYLPLAFYIGAEKNETLLGKIGIKYQKDIWDEENSPLKKNFHIEDFQLVPECTKKDKDDKNADGNSVIRDIFEDMPSIEDIANDFLQSKNGLTISTYYARLDENQSDTLLVTGLPNGYKISDLKFSSTDNNVATVSKNGSIKAISSGNCLIKVETKDGLYSQYCAIYVLASYDVDFTPLNFSEMVNYHAVI